MAMLRERQEPCEKKIRENSGDRSEGEGRTKEKMRKLCEVVNNTREKAEKGRMEKRGLEKDGKKKSDHF